MTTEGAPTEKTPLFQNPFLWGFILGALALIAIRPIQLAMRSAPPPLVEVGAWTLTDQDGKPFGSKDLEGKVWIADFFFTRCPSICPELTRKMKEVQKRLADRPDKVHLVSFTVDPEHDTPEVLREYMKKFEIDPSQWTFVTGTREELYALLVGQMRLHMGEKEPIEGAYPQAELYDISHVSRFALFDQNGDLRALASTDPHGLARLVDGALLLIEEGPDP